MRLSEFAFSEPEDKSAVGRLPDHVRDDLVTARKARSHSIPQMVEWLHNDPEHGDAYRHIHAELLHAWFRRRGLVGRKDEADGGRSK